MFPCCEECWAEMTEEQKVLAVSDLWEKWRAEPPNTPSLNGLPWPKVLDNAVASVRSGG